MRIIGGTAKGRRLHAPHDLAIRPTADRAREALFSILGQEVRGAKVLDLFAGTGAFGLEALSRGASVAVFVDILPAAIALVQKNIVFCGFSERSVVHCLDLRKGLFHLQGQAGASGFSVVFLDPPYGKDLAVGVLTQLGQEGLVSPTGLVVAEERSRVLLPESCGLLHLVDQRRYGDTGFWIYRMVGEGSR